ncbi:MAG: moderate conductance mechanosensitive channel [Actinomycetota bacterium]|nr:moderate conductance mechanosensitive channel [Actinomycetota bacterium]
MIAVAISTVTTQEVSACGATGSAACLAVYRWTHNELAAKATDWFVAKPLTIGIVLVIALVATRLLTRAIRRFMHGVELAAGTDASVRVHQRTETIGLVLRGVVRISVAVIAGSTVLGELGVNLGPLIAGAGIAGVALGFGAQSLVKDFLSGMFMLIEDQFGVGDVIDVGDAIGTVEAVSLRATRVRSVDGTLWHVPNGSIARVGNKSQEWSRALLDIEVAYGVDLDKAQQVIKQVADALWKDPQFADSVLEEPEVWGVEKLGATGVAIRLVVKTRPKDQWKVLRALRQRITHGFTEAGVATPGQQAIWIQPAT